MRRFAPSASMKRRFTQFLKRSCAPVRLTWRLPGRCDICWMWHHLRIGPQLRLAAIGCLPLRPLASPDFPTPDALGGNGKDVLSLFSIDMSGTAFVPGLYRLLAHWPVYVAHVAVELQPLFGRPDIVDACRNIVDRFDAIGLVLTEGLVAGPPPFDAATAEQLRMSLDAYRGTKSPHMIVLSTFLRDALPAA